MGLKIPDNLIHASFFFVDIVGLSSPDMSTNTQTSKIKFLNQCISECNSFTSISEDEKLVLPTGDGMAIGFLAGLEHPLNLATEVHKKLNEYNQTKVDTDKILVRIGCHSGNIFVVDDVLGNKNFWGPGIIMARRVMDLGDASHILMTSTMAESLIELSDNYKEMIHPMHDYQLKHKEIVLLYSVYGNDFGNSNTPKRGLLAKPKLQDGIGTAKKTISYNSVEFDLGLKNSKTNLLDTKRTYYFMNHSEEPIFEVSNGIITNVEKNFAELDVKASDEKNRDLQIKGINVDSPFRKEFTLKLNDPVFSGDENKSFSVRYHSEEPDRFFENMFLINTQKFILKFSFPTNEGVDKPKLYHIKHQDRDKKILDMDPDIKQGVVTQVKWEIDSGISENDMIRLEW